MVAIAKSIIKLIINISTKKPGKWHPVVRSEKLLARN